MISDIQANHFTKYILTATNEIGDRTINVALNQGSPPKHHNKQPNDQASQPNNPGEWKDPSAVLTFESDCSASTFCSILNSPFNLKNNP